jgi:hypothetical protein
MGAFRFCLALWSAPQKYGRPHFCNAHGKEYPAMPKLPSRPIKAREQWDSEGTRPAGPWGHNADRARPHRCPYPARPSGRTGRRIGCSCSRTFFVSAPIGVAATIQPGPRWRRPGLASAVVGHSRFGPRWYCANKGDCHLLPRPIALDFLSSYRRLLGRCHRRHRSRVEADRRRPRPRPCIDGGASESTARSETEALRNLRDPRWSRLVADRCPSRTRRLRVAPLLPGAGGASISA